MLHMPQVSFVPYAEPMCDTRHSEGFFLQSLFRALLAISLAFLLLVGMFHVDSGALQLCSAR